MTGSVIFKGGLLMYPLLLCSVFSIALIIEKSIMLMKLRINNSVYGEILSLAEKKNFNKLNKLIKNSSKSTNPPAMQFISDIINGDIKSSDEYKMLIGIVIIKYSERIHYLDLIARISPMIGLTGTVIGLAKTFQAVSFNRCNCRSGNSCGRYLGGNDNNNNRTSYCNPGPCRKSYSEKSYQQLFI